MFFYTNLSSMDTYSRPIDVKRQFLRLLTKISFIAENNTIVKEFDEDDQVLMCQYLEKIDEDMNSICATLDDLRNLVLDLLASMFIFSLK